jgi:DNA-binding MarR family transcriptional regulator
MILMRYGIGVDNARPNGPRAGVAFLLSQLGAHASERFAHTLAEHDLSPALAGIMRLLSTEADWSQQRLAERLGMVPSRIVAYVDDLEARGWIARTRDSSDRRVNLLTVTAAGAAAFGEIATVARRHEREITAGLDDADRESLLRLLQKLAAASDLSPGVHPGYRRV